MSNWRLRGSGDNLMFGLGPEAVGLRLFDSFTCSAWLTSSANR
jgi:hypothetical protein